MSDYEALAEFHDLFMTTPWERPPSTAMRSILLHRVAASVEMAARISVVAGSVPNALTTLPARVHGVLATHMVGHLSAGDRAAWWRWLASALAPGAMALVTY